MQCKACHQFDGEITLGVANAQELSNGFASQWRDVLFPSLQVVRLVTCCASSQVFG